jgi:hypothetical protein
LYRHGSTLSPKRGGIPPCLPWLKPRHEFIAATSAKDLPSTRLEVTLVTLFLFQPNHWISSLLTGNPRSLSATTRAAPFGTQSQTPTGSDQEWSYRWSKQVPCGKLGRARLSKRAQVFICSFLFGSLYLFFFSKPAPPSSS